MLSNPYHLLSLVLERFPCCGVLLLLERDLQDGKLEIEERRIGMLDVFMSGALLLLLPGGVGGGTQLL